MFHVPERYRVTSGPMASTSAAGNNGAFRLALKARSEDRRVQVIASDGAGWEHVSVVWSRAVPTWEMMCQVKALFWDPDDCVLQYHPPESDYVNAHPHCLHLWRPVGVDLPRPPAWMVGPRRQPL